MSKKRYTYYTQESTDRLCEELNDLKTNQRTHVALQLEEARSKGDLSENAEYDAAKETQRKLEIKIYELEEEIRYIRIIDKSKLDTKHVSILNKIKVENVTNGQTFDYQLVSKREMNIREGKISIESPIGQGLLGKKVGEEVKIKVPTGQLILKIISITLPN